MMKRFLPFALVIAALILAACGGARSESISSYDMAGGAPEAPMYALPPADEFAVSGEVANRAADSSVPATSVERMVLKNAQLSIVTADVEARMQAVQILAEQMGGFVVSSNLYESYASNNVSVPEAQVVVRVPAEKLDEALTNIKKDADEVKSESKSGEDVTAQYVDLQSRLKNLQAAEAQLDEIMKRAQNTEDVVNVFDKLTYYREQIELVKGQMKYYEESAALSSITVTIIAAEKEKPIEIGGWKPSGVAREAIQDLIYFYQDFVDWLIRFVIYTLPVLVTLAIPLYLVFLALRAVFRWLKPKKKAAPQVEPAPVEKK